MATTMVQCQNSSDHPKKWKVSICVLMTYLCLNQVWCGNPDAKRLYDDLLSNYNKLVRPVINNTKALTVKIKLKLSQLIDVVRMIDFVFLLSV